MPSCYLLDRTWISGSDSLLTTPSYVFIAPGGTGEDDPDTDSSVDGQIRWTWEELKVGAGRQMSK